MSRLRKLANIEEEYDQEYKNRYGQVTPYHILFKDHGNEIAALSVDGAIQHCIDSIDELNEKYRDDPNFYQISEEEKAQLLQAFRDGEVDSGMDILFIVKDFLLQTEGLEVDASRLKKGRK